MRQGTFDVAVAGNGVLGLSIAWELLRRAPDLRVVVIGPAARDGSATVAAGAMLNCFAEVTDTTAQHPASQAKFTLGRQALDAWPQWLDGLWEAAGTPGPRSSRTEGTFVVLGAQATATATRSFDAVHAALKEHAEPHHEIDSCEVPGMRPVPHERPVRALYLEREGSVDARAVLTALETAVRRAGATFLDGEATALVSAHDRILGLRMADGQSVTAGTVVLAAGAGTQRLMDQLPLGETPPVLHGAGAAVQTRRERAPCCASPSSSSTRAWACPRSSDGTTEAAPSPWTASPSSALPP